MDIEFKKLKKSERDLIVKALKTKQNVQIDEIIEDLNMLTLESEYPDWKKEDMWQRVQKITEELEKLKIGW